MVGPAIQHSFNSGEWNPKLNARVDLQKYHQGAALLKNFFVDYRGGATTRGGTRYCLQCFKSEVGKPVRIIGFQASLAVGYVLELGDFYMRFFSNGAPVLETALTITAATSASPGVFTHNAHGYSNGQWVQAKTFAGGTGWSGLNNNYYIIANKTANDFQLTDLFGTAVNTTGFGTYTASSGTTARVYKIDTPWAAADLAALKFEQNVDKMVFCHPNYAPYQLLLVSAASWTLGAITFGTTVTAPTGGAVSASGAVSGAGTVNYAYVVTAVDSNGQESAPSAFKTLANILDIRVAAGTIDVTWSAVTGAVSYNIYRAVPRYGTAVAVGSQFGFIGNVTGTAIADSNIEPDYAFGPPLIQNPFSGTGVQTLTLTGNGTLYQAVPDVTLTASPGVTAHASAGLAAYQIDVVAGGFGFLVGDVVTFLGGAGGCRGRVTSISFGGVITGLAVDSPGLITGAGTSIPSNPVVEISGTHGTTQFTIRWRVSYLYLDSPGTGYLLTPTVSFSGGSPGSAATATATLGAASAGNPTVPKFHQQRLFMMGPLGSPQQVNASKPGQYYNYDISFPLQPDDAFQGTLVSGQLNSIQSAVSQPQGLILLSDSQAWLINGGSPGSGIDSTNVVSNAHIFTGAASQPAPIIAVDDILFVQSKNSIVRDLIFDFGKQVYTGQDISAISSHLFYGYQIMEWCFAEEPFKVVWAVRNDGQLLSLTFLKEQEFCAWTHSDTTGSFVSTCKVVETVQVGKVDAPYFIVQRQVNGITANYIERMSDLYYPTGVTDAWQVDSGLQYNGAAALSFTGASHLSGLSVTGLATDDTGEVTVITAFTMASNGAFTLAAPPSPATGYTRVTVGLAFTPQLKTLGIDLGEPTIQSVMKKISSVVLRCSETLGLKIGSDFTAANLVDIPDLTLGSVGTMTNELVTDLVTGDAYSTLDPEWATEGSYCIQQDLPYPASILGVIPQVAIGNTSTPRSR